MLHLILTRLVRHGGISLHTSPATTAWAQAPNCPYFTCLESRAQHPSTVDSQTPLENSLNSALLTLSEIRLDWAAGKMLWLWLHLHCLLDYKWCWEISDIKVYSQKHNWRTSMSNLLPLSSQIHTVKTVQTKSRNSGTRSLPLYI